MTTEATPDRGVSTRHWILHQRARAYYWEEPGGWLSVKSIVSGQATYDIEGGRFRVGPDGYLVLNEAQPYVVTIDEPEPVESFCVFFPHGFAADVARALSRSHAALLDDPVGERAPLRIFERVTPHDDEVTPLLRQLRRDRSAIVRDGSLAERMHTLMEHLLAARAAVKPLEDAMPAARAATRAELFRRLSRARDFLDASIDRPAPLETVAAIAGLSPHHFLRTFKQVYRQTPHAYVTARRLERARALLAGTALTATEVCLRVGFESLGTFSTLFKREVGLSPARFRLAVSSANRKIEEANVAADA